MEKVSIDLLINKFETGRGSFCFFILRITIESMFHKNPEETLLIKVISCSSHYPLQGFVEKKKKVKKKWKNLGKEKCKTEKKNEKKNEKK